MCNKNSAVPSAPGAACNGECQEVLYGQKRRRKGGRCVDQLTSHESHPHSNFRLWMWCGRKNSMGEKWGKKYRVHILPRKTTKSNFIGIQPSNWAYS